MAPATRLCLALPLRAGAATAAAAASRGSSSRRLAASAAARAIHTNPAQPAKVVPVYGTGPPPDPPQPSPEPAAEDQAERAERLARRRRQAEMLKQAGDIRAMRLQQQREKQQQQQKGGGATKPDSTGLKRRFWKDVRVKEVDDHLEIHLDARPLRHPTTKAILHLPASKPDLAHALALEWDALTSAQQATRQHLIPLTSLACRALDVAADPALRAGIAETVLRYLDTDSLLCFAPPPEHPPAEGDDGPTLRQRQEEAYASTAAYLTTHVWPGVSIVPVLDGASIMPRQQPPGTREVVQGWVLGSLSAFELAGLERATLAGKSLLAAARLVAEWSEEGAGAARPPSPAADGGAGGVERFGVEEAARAVSLEVAFQTRQWGEVEDTHDVDKEDVRRQFGSVVLLISGTGTSKAAKSS